MPEPSTDWRSASGFPEKPPLARAPAPSEGHGQAGSIAVAFILRAVRRHRLLFLPLAILTAGAALFTLKSPALYQATAVLRLAGERRAVAAGMETVAPTLDRNSAPLLSLVPMLRSRAVVGAVVDSLSLQLQPETFSRWRSRSGPTPLALGLTQVSVQPDSPRDTLSLRFEADSLLVWREDRWVKEGYGKSVEAAGVRFIIPTQPEAAGAALAVIPRDVAIDNALERLAVVPVTGTDAVELKFTDSDPAVAQRAVNVLLETFQASTIRASQEQARRRRLFLADQLEETSRLLAQAQGDLSTFRSRQRIANSADELAMRQAALMTLDTRRGEMEANRHVFRALLTQLESTDDSARVEGLRTLAYSPEIATDPIVGSLYQQLLVYRTRLDSLTTGPWRSSSTNPDVVQLKQLLSSSQQELVRAVRANLQSLEQRTAALGSMRSSQSSQIQALPALEAEETRLGQQVVALGSLADQLRLDHQKSRMSEELAAGDIDVVDLASRPYRPVGVPWWVKVGLALFVGLAGGAGVAVLLESRNHSIRAPEELRLTLPVPGLGIIPHVQEATPPRSLAALRQRLTNGAGERQMQAGLVEDSQWPSVGAEAFRLLYSSLLLTWNQGSRTILVTSTAPQEGKTLVASNLAVTFAREGARVLLIDCDLRRPRLHRVFGLSRAPGLMELLKPASLPADPTWSEIRDRSASGHAYSMAPEVGRGVREIPPPPARTSEPEASRVPGISGGAHPSSSGRTGSRTASIRSTGVRGLSVLTCGTLPDRPAEALRAGNMRGLLRELSGEFDVIIVDTPPVLVSADAPILAPLADDVLMVIRAGQTDREAVERAYEQLAAAGASIVGAVLNDPAGEVSRYRKLYYAYDYPAVSD